MWTSRFFKRAVGVATVIGVLASVGAATGCTDEEPSPCPTDTRPGLAIAVGGRANSPVPKLSEHIESAITAATDAAHGITFIRIDGRPSVSCALSFTPTGGTEDSRQHQRRSFLNAVAGAFAGARAKEAEADPLGALSLAVAAAGPGGTVILVDSGLQTAAPLDLRQNLLGKDPQAIADELRRSGHLPDLTGMRVILSGIGYTAAPQAGLDEPRRAWIVRLWTAIVVNAGAVDPVVESSPATGEAVPDVPPVSTIDIQKTTISIACDTTSVLGEDTVAFIPDTANFINPSSARETLLPFADFLKANPTARAVLTGTIAHYGDRNMTGGLDLQRARRVGQELVSLGAAPGQVEARGGGWGPFPDPSAPPHADYDQANRRVLVTISCARDS